MGLEVAISLEFFDSTPREVVLCLINSGWRYVLDGEVNLLVDDKDGELDFLTVAEENFSLDGFLKASKNAKKFGMTIVNEQNIGGQFLIDKNIFTFMPHLHRQYLNLEYRIVDFSWYLNKFEVLYKRFTIVNTECSCYT